MVYVHVPHTHGATKKSPHETAIAFYIVALITLGFAIFVVLVGPKTGSPPPPIVRWVLITMFASIGLLALFSLLKWQGEDDGPSQDPDSEEEK
jgi:hypothetical protein